MDTEDFDPAGFSGTVPVFPLPNVVLFPGMFLPLHIFEPRYRAMTRAALEGERLIAMALLQPGVRSDAQGEPEFHPILGLGRIVEDVLLDDGRFNLVLYGLVRVRVLAEVRREPFRTVRVEVLDEIQAQGAGYARKRKILFGFYTQILQEITKGKLASPPEDVPLGMLCDLLISLISFEPPVKQELLSQLNVGKRCDRLLDLLQALNAPGFGGAGEPAKRPWPPGPSLN